MLKNII